MTALHDGAPLQRYPGPALPSDDHIRLISLQPGNRESPIVCKLVTADLASVPPYEALSYTWGDPADCEVIHVKAGDTDRGRGADEKLHVMEFLVTRNCVAALRRLRLEDRPRTLWIDALGINQSDVSERNHQVSLMSQIYSKSSSVAICLGESDEDSDLALEAIKDVDGPGEDTTSLSYARHEGLLRALEAFFRRPWFSRVWVIQEAVLSEGGTVYCGSRVVEWSAIRNFHEWNTNKWWLSSLPFVVSTSRARLIKEDAQTSMLNALQKTRHCEATDPRDKVYSLLPLMHSIDGDGQLGIAPRYHDPVAKVYTDCAAALIGRLGYRILHAVQGGSKVDGLPSWVPDWSVPPRRQIIGARGNSGREDFWEKHKRVDAPHQPLLMTTAAAAAAAAANEPSRSLRVAGFSAGKIKALGSTYMAGRGLFPLKEWEGLIGEDRAVSWIHDKAFYMVLVSDCFAYPSAIRLFLEKERKREEAGSKVSWESSVRKLLAERGGGGGGGGGDKDEGQGKENDESGEDEYVLPLAEIPFHTAGDGLPPSYATYVQFVLRNCHSRRFFVTDRGHMGLAPAEAEVGDEVVLCVGAEAPFVMREKKDVCDGDGDGDDGRMRRRVSLVGESFMELRVWRDVKGADGVEEFDIV